jgi:phage terminase small subunit
LAKEEYKLNAREQRFADEYISNGRNATQAYKTISPNAKATTCATKGLVMVRKESVAGYIKSKTRERLNASNLTAQDVLDELIAIGFAKPQKGVSKQFDRLNNEVVLDMEYENTAKHEDRLKALELLGKNLALFTDKQDVNLSGTVVFVDDVPLDDDD